MHPLVYLSGPIRGLNYGNCTSWRRFAEKELADAGIQALSPMRWQSHREGLGKIEGPNEAHPMTTARGLTSRDRYDTLRCDVMLVNLLAAQVVSIGTVLEIAWADSKRTPIVLVMEDPTLETRNIHEHVMIDQLISFRTNTLEHGIEIVKQLLLPESKFQLNV